MSACCICKKHRVPGSSVTFHRFPTDKNLARTWCKIIGLEHLPLPSARVCEEHFGDEDYSAVYGLTKTKMLVAGAVPNKNMPPSDNKRKADPPNPVPTKHARVEVPPYLLEIADILNETADSNTVEYFHDSSAQTITIRYDGKTEPQLPGVKHSVFCHRCNAVFKNQSDLKLHMKICIEKLKPYQCATCSASFDTIGALGKHKCNQTPDEDQSKPIKKSHDQMEEGFRMSAEDQEKLGFLSRSIAGKEYDSDSEGYDSTDESRPNKKCEECMCLIPVRKMESHYQKRHEGCAPPFACRVCEARFASCAELCKHLKSHSRDQLAECTKKHPNGLRYFRRNYHHFECCLCGNVFDTEEAVRVHQVTHLSERIGCPICRSVFSDKSTFLEHLREHQGI
ncbi:zinc finger protein 26-like [Topomyia yanbarensis]|uniref:zinc finger protein 26-like n=1 Tax=Topomyia yanbarensis TaxID=2498891 RepID=UPI00273B6DB2|nr:zinc finger protein 26-like [Topomyia yanbarensis]XP_058814378.1 zinc finger protein 26-like [Topomyia yanbarensis]